MLSWIKDKIKGVKSQEECIFCQIRDDPTNQKLNKQKCFLYDDEQFFVIHDIKKASARQHILILTKKHIRSALDIKDLETIIKMKQIGIKVLRNLQKENWLKEEQIKDLNQKIQNYRLGFHIPPYNSIDHIHLHGFLQPLTEWNYDKLLYGWVMTPVDQLTKKIRK